MSSHKEYIKKVLEYDLNPYYEKEERMGGFIEENLQNVQRLAELECVIDRLPYFEILLNESLEKKEITPEEKQTIISYIQMGEKQKKPVANYCDFNSFNFMRFKNRLPDKENAIWRKIANIVKEIEMIESEKLTLSGNRGEYEQLKYNRDRILKLIDPLDEELQIEREKISNVFKAESILNANELHTLCINADNKKAELIVIDTKDPDPDLAAVIQMRAKKSTEKGNQLVVISFDEFNAIMQSGQDVNGLTKLSFLHHGKDDYGYASKISDYIRHLPDLKEIVLRGCGTANAPTSQQPVYEAKIINLAYDKNPPVQGTNQLMIQQQEDRDGKVLTRVSWRTKDPEKNKLVLHELKDIENIPKMTGKKPSDEQLIILERIPGMPLLKHSSTYIHSIKSSFFNKNKEISSEELANTKKALRRARTESAPTEEDLLSTILSNMTSDQQAKISVKAYVGGYQVLQGRVIPNADHDQERYPKAVRRGPSF